MERLSIEPHIPLDDCTSAGQGSESRPCPVVMRQKGTHLHPSPCMGILVLTYFYRQFFLDSQLSLLHAHILLTLSLHCYYILKFNKRTQTTRKNTKNDAFVGPPLLSSFIFVSPST